MLVCAAVSRLEEVLHMIAFTCTIGKLSDNIAEQRV